MRAQEEGEEDDEDEEMGDVEVVVVSEEQTRGGRGRQKPAAAAAASSTKAKIPASKLKATPGKAATEAASKAVVDAIDLISSEDEQFLGTLSDDEEEQKSTEGQQTLHYLRGIEHLCGFAHLVVFLPFGCFFAFCVKLFLPSRNSTLTTSSASGGPPL